ncbi:hypothetical protein [Picosynechococcus sp. PCC 8807]|uniref:hypothetical protein n=1 Tax=Picosynechococcus sp. PCC 8807 TaxID=195248 RepID=UPI000810E568|nr:hypothetical protein [Picosynechococcus sp. PCC 8807]ANV92015.1 hypothetical protein AWQ24_14645 [Picosynechococcus sp. PCC 8807]
MSLESELKQFMHRIRIQNGNGWKGIKPHGILEDYAVPSSIDCRCGYCGVQGALICEDAVTFNNPTQTITLKARCTRDKCQKTSTVVIIDALMWRDHSKGKRSKEFWVLPKPKERPQVFTEDQIDNRRIFKAYQEAVQSFNENRPSLVISACGRIVEAIGKLKFPDGQSANNIGKLYRNLKNELKDKPEFNTVLDPFLQLGNALRIGRNPASHFDLETDPDINLAEKVLDLTEFLVKYIYVIPQEADNVNELIEKCGPGDTEESDEG